MPQKNTKTAVKTDDTFFHVLETTLNGFISVDQHWTILYSSHNFEKTHLAPGKNLWECLSGCEYLPWKAELHKAAALRDAVQFEQYYEPLDLWVEIIVQPYGNTLSIYFKNNATQKEQVRKFQEIQFRLDQILDLSSEIFWEYDIATQKAFWHGNKLANLLNHDRENPDPVEIWKKHVHPDDLQTIRSSFEAALQNTELSYTCEYRLQEKDGDYIYVKDRGQIIRNSTGEPLKAFGILRDISIQKRYEQALKASEQKLLTILESIGDGLLVMDRNWTITYLNGKAENLLGHNKAYFLDRNLWDAFNDAVELNSFRMYHLAMEENIPVRFEDYYPALNAWFEINAYPTSDGLSIYFNNITDKKRQEEERKQSQEKLRRAEEDLRHVLESMTDGFYTVDRTWNIKFATDKVAAMMGVNKEDYLEKNLWDCYPEAVGSKVYTEFHKAFAEGIPVSFEEYNPVYNMWFDINAYPHGDILAVYTKDITERKNNEKRLEFIARATSEVIWELDIASRESTINEEKFHSVFGYSLPPKSCHYTFWLDKVHPEDAQLVIQKNRQALEQHLYYFMNEYRFKKSDGTWAYVRDRVHVVKDALNKPVKLIGAIEDITKERIAEKALLESKQTYKQLFDNASLPKAVYDRETLRILNVNQAAIDHYGYSREEFLQMTILDVRPSEDHGKVKEVVTKTDMNSRVNQGVWTHIKKGGERIQVEVSLATINYKGKVCNLSTVNDVTEKLKLQEQLTQEKVARQQSITKAAMEAQEKERSGIARELHDSVNQVLTTAKLYVENILYFPDQKDAFVEKSISLIQNSINEIRVLSKALVTPAITDLGFNEALEEMIKNYRELNLFEIGYTIDAAVEQVENEIKLTLYRIIQEQLNNIVKYAKASRINVQILKKCQELSLTIEDNGIGFDPVQKKKGLGLKNIKNRAELFNGKASIHSAPGKGCKIEIEFSIKESC